MENLLFGPALQYRIPLLPGQSPADAWAFHAHLALAEGVCPSCLRLLEAPGTCERDGQSWSGGACLRCKVWWWRETAGRHLAADSMPGRPDRPFFHAG